jgi:hypothetical protein
LAATISQYFIGSLMPESANPVQQPQTIIEIRPYRGGCYEGPGVGPYWTGEHAKSSASRKAKRPQPTHQAKLVMWHLITRVPLNFAAIPETEIKAACEKFNLRLDTWHRQECAFGLLKKVYAKRSAIGGQQQPPVVPTWAEQCQDWPSDSYGDEYLD